MILNTAVYNNGSFLVGKKKATLVYPHLFNIQPFHARLKVPRKVGPVYTVTPLNLQRFFYFIHKEVAVHKLII